MKYKSIHIRNNEYQAISDYLMYDIVKQMSIQKLQKRIDSEYNYNIMYKDQYKALTKELTILKEKKYYGVFVR